MTARTLQRVTNRICNLCGVTKDERPKVWYGRFPDHIFLERERSGAGLYKEGLVSANSTIWIDAVWHRTRPSWIWHTLGHELGHHLVAIKGIRLQSNEDEERLCDLVGRVAMEIMQDG